MKGLLTFLRERARQLGVGDRGIVFAGAALVVAATAGAIWVYTTVTQPSVSGVLPLGSEDFEQGEVLIKFKPGTPAEDMRNFHAQNNLTELETLGKIGVSRMKIPPGFSVGETVTRLKNNPNVEFVEPNYLREAADSPDDKYFPNQWALAKINAPAAWDISKGSSSVVIAVVDTGLDTAHDDLKAKHVASPAAPLDDNGHGTLVSGVAVASSSNTIGVAGLCRLCSLLAVKSLGSTGSGSDTEVANGIIAAADAGAKVINLSLGSSANSNTLQNAVNYAWNTKGAVVIASSGNTPSPPIAMYPAAFDNVIAVGSTTSNDVRATDSNYGPWLDVVAPGYSVMTTLRGNSYGPQSGTSLAAPYVAGLAGLILSANPSLTNAQVKDIITSTAKDLGTAGRDDQYGYGRIDALAALQKATGATSTLQQQTVPTATPTATLAPTSTVSAQSAATATPVPTATAATATPVPTATTAPAATATPVATATVAPATATPTATPSGPAMVTEAFSGSVDQRRGPAQANHTIQVSAAGSISASLNWGGGADLDLLLLNPAGQQVASATGKGKPQSLSFNATATGTYTLRVVAASGSASYTLSVTHP